MLCKKRLLRFSYRFCLDFGNRYLSLNLSCSEVIYSSSVKLECRLQMKNSFSVKFICKLLFIKKKYSGFCCSYKQLRLDYLKNFMHELFICNWTLEWKTKLEICHKYTFSFLPLARNPCLLNEICFTPEKMPYCLLPVLDWVTTSALFRQWFYREEEKGGWGSGCTWWLVRYCPEIGMYIQFNSCASTLVCTYNSIVGQVH